jgi:SSS family solute:Na+ symporter
MSQNLAPIDYLGLVAYLAATVWIGVAVGRRVKSGADYFLAGRSLPWWAVGMSLVATDIGGTDIIGVGGAAYSYGIAVGNFEWIGCVPAMIVAAFVFIPHFWRLGIYTIPEFMERRYNSALRTALATCWLVFMACNLGIMLLASAKMMSLLFGWDQAACIFVTAGLVGVYTVAGGLAAVVYTDAVQCAVMIAGCLMVVLLGVQQAGGVGNLIAQVRELDAVQASKPSEGPAARHDTGEPPRATLDRTSLIQPVDTPSPFPWTGIFFGLALVLSPAYWIGNQAIVQRSLGAKSEFQAKAAYVWGALLKNVIPFIIVVPGLVALVQFPELDDADLAIPQLVARVLPYGVRGIFVAAFLAALMSSIDSYLNSAATILTNDLYTRFLRPDAGPEHLLLVGRVTTLALVLWAIVAAFLFMLMQSGIYAIFQTLMAFFQGPALAVLLCGLLWKRATGIAALVAFVAGVLTSISLYALNQPLVYTAFGLEPLFQIAEPFLYFSVWAFLVSLTLVVVLSFASAPEPEEKTRHVVFSGFRRTAA